jgi:hypothetical protein
VNYVGIGGRGYTPETGPELDAGGVAIMGLGIAAVLCVALIGAASAIAAIATVGYVIFAALLYRRAIKAGEAIRFRKMVVALLWISTVGSVLSGLLVFRWHWFPFTVAECIVTITYIAALGLGLLRVLSKLLKFLAVLLTFTMVTSAIVLPVPKGGEDTSDEDNHWSVIVTVIDQDGNPLAGALAQCIVLIDWLDSYSVEEIAPRITHRSGSADSWEFTEDRRLKSVLCGAQKPSDSRNGDYPFRTMMLVAPHHGENDIEITLTENSPSDR